MPYSAEISRTQPVAFLLLLDQSASMQDPFGGAEQQGDAAPSKARVLADTVNRLLQNLILRCAKEDGVRDYFHVAAIGYGERVEALIRSDASADVDPAMVPVSALADRPLRLEPRTKTMPDGRGGTVDRVVQTPVWLDPYAKNGTPMCQALDYATQVARTWIDAYPRAFPPVVLNITDGEATDGDPLRYAQQLRSFGSDDGEVLLLNVHLS
ncbi:MAG: vWA domain-containing protein, partial [Bacteroidota bacterium]